MSSITHNYNEPDRIKTTYFSYLTGLMFALVYCDSLITYFGQFLRGVQPAQIYVPLFVIFLLVSGYKKALPDIKTGFLLVVMFLAFAMGVFTAPDITERRFLEVISAFTAFMIGYNFFSHNTDENKLFWFLSLLSFIYISVCVVALLKYFPAIFPLEIALWSNQGNLNERPAITTDQNFQVFYLFAPVLLVLLRSGWLKLLLTLILLAGAAYVVIKVQSRSGILVFAGGTFLAIIFHFISKEGNKLNIIIFTLLAILLSYKLIPVIYNIMEPLLARFSSSGFEKSTADARLTSALRVFDLLQDPANWVPRGNPESLLGRNKSHSNVTAILLESGLLGLLAWILLFIYPVIRLIKKYFLGIDVYCLVAFLAGLMSLILQMTLNVPVMDQVWLWAGATNGALVRKIQTSVIRVRTGY